MLALAEQVVPEGYVVVPVALVVLEPIQVELRAREATAVCSS